MDPIQLEECLNVFSFLKLKPLTVSHFHIFLKPVEQKALVCCIRSMGKACLPQLLPVKIPVLFPDPSLKGSSQLPS